MAALADGVVVLRGATEDDLPEIARFRQSNNFYYLTGVTTPGAYLVLNPYAEPGTRETLYLPARSPAREKWTGPQPGPDAETAARFGIERVRDAAELDSDIGAVLRSDAVLQQVRAGQRVFVYTERPIGEGARFSRYHAFADHLAELLPHGIGSRIAVAGVSYALGELRRTKSQNELLVTQRAIDITLEAQRDAAATIRPGRFEYEVEAVIMAAFLRNGAMHVAFPSIVGSGLYSTILHYNDNWKRIDGGDLVVVDIGAEYAYYTADVTRTYPASGRFTDRQRAIYQLVLDAQTAAANAYRPGMKIADLHRVAMETLRNSPLRDSQGQTLERHFIHGLSHFLGMDVHDVGDYTLPLRPGDLFTIEPGVYLPDEKLGVRIEDDYLVTSDGLVKLSRGLPSTPDEIEAMMRRSP